MDFYIEVILDNEYITTKIDTFVCKIKTDFHDGGLPQVKNPYAEYWRKFVDLVYRRDKNYYPQAFLEACKYKFKAKMIKKFITEDLTDCGSNCISK